MSNTVLAVVGGPCVGKTTLIRYIENKFKGRLQADLVCVPRDNDETSSEVIKRNAAEEDPSFMYSFLVSLLQSTMKTYSASFSALKPRQFLIIEDSIEFVDLMIHAAKSAKLISAEEWTWLRTLTDEFLEFSAIDMFVVISSDDFPVCENFHKGAKSRRVHINGSVIMKWAAAISSLLPEWIARQKARKKYIFEMSPRISKFTILSKTKQILNAVFGLANMKLGTGFPKMESPLDKPDRVEAALRSWVNSHGRSVSFVTPQEHLSDMPPKKKTSASSSVTQVGDMEDPRYHQEARRLSAQVRQNLVNQPPIPSGNLFPHAPTQGYPVQSVAQYQNEPRAQVPPVGRSTPFQGYSSASAPPALMRDVNPSLNLGSVFGVEDDTSPRVTKRSASEPGSSSESGDVRTDSDDSSDTAAAKRSKKKKRSAKKAKRDNSPDLLLQEASVFDQACQEARMISQASDGAGPSGLSSDMDYSDVFPSSPARQPRGSSVRSQERELRRLESEEDYARDERRDERPLTRPAEYAREDRERGFSGVHPPAHHARDHAYHPPHRSFPPESDRDIVPHPRATVAPVQRPPQSPTVSYVPGDSRHRGGDQSPQNPSVFQHPDMVRDASRGRSSSGLTREQLMWEEDAQDAMAFRRFRMEKRRRLEMMWRQREEFPSRNRFVSWDDDLDGMLFSNYTLS